jgi:hypothetical protein
MFEFLNNIWMSAALALHKFDIVDIIIMVAQHIRTLSSLCFYRLPFKSAPQITHLYYGTKIKSETDPPPYHCLQPPPFYSSQGHPCC